LLRAKAYAAGGGICYWQGDFVTANRYYTSALAAARETAAESEIALALYNISFASLDQEAGTQDARFAGGRRFAEEALVLYEKLGDQHGIANCHWALAIASAAVGDLPDAKVHAEQALAAYRRLNDPFGIGWGAHMLTLYSVGDLDLDRAKGYATESLTTFRRTGDLSGTILTIYDWAIIAERQGQRERHVRLSGAVDALGKASGIGVMRDSFNILDWRLPEPPTDEEGMRWWANGAAMSAEQAADYALEGATAGDGASGS
jgi:tetratricopeptide (TPR) repeat protein